MTTTKQSPDSSSDSSDGASPKAGQDGESRNGRKSERVLPTTPLGQRSLGELVATLSRDVALLVHQEIELVKAELKAAVAKVAVGAAGFVVAVLGLLFAVVFEIRVGLALAGAGAFFILPVAPLPNVEFPGVMVTANLAGASPENMATSVATPLERRLGVISGVNEITSSSSTGSTRTAPRPSSTTQSALTVWRLR